LQGGVSASQALEHIAAAQCAVSEVKFSRIIPNGVIKGGAAAAEAGARAVCKARPLRADERVAYCWWIRDSAPQNAGANE